MPGQLPTDPKGVLEFVATRAEVWREHRGLLGLSAALAQSVVDELGAAQDAQAQAEARRLAAQAATQAYYQAAESLRTRAAAALRVIQTSAAISGDVQTATDIYVAARIDPPARPRRSAGPATAPFSLRAALNTSTGAIELSWKSRQPRSVRGVMFQVCRSIGKPSGDRTFLGVTGARRFVDDALPMPESRRTGLGQDLTYFVTALRGGTTARGADELLAHSSATAVLVVRIGTGQSSSDADARHARHTRRAA